MLSFFGAVAMVGPAPMLLNDAGQFRHEGHLICGQGTETVKKNAKKRT